MTHRSSFCANHANDVRFTVMPEILPHHNTGCTYLVGRRGAKLLDSVTVHVQLLRGHTHITSQGSERQIFDVAI